MQQPGSRHTARVACGRERRLPARTSRIRSRRGRPVRVRRSCSSNAESCAATSRRASPGGSPKATCWCSARAIPPAFRLGGAGRSASCSALRVSGSRARSHWRASSSNPRRCGPPPCALARTRRGVRRCACARSPLPRASRSQRRRLRQAVRALELLAIAVAAGSQAQAEAPRRRRSVARLALAEALEALAREPGDGLTLVAARRAPGPLRAPGLATGARATREQSRRPRDRAACRAREAPAGRERPGRDRCRRRRGLRLARPLQSGLPVAQREHAERLPHGSAATRSDGERGAGSAPRARRRRAVVRPRGRARHARLAAQLLLHDREHPGGEGGRCLRSAPRSPNTRVSTRSVTRCATSAEGVRRNTNA